MVYRGKISASCGPCRQRRTKCDGVRPDCGQCRRTSRTCSGYRNADVLRVLNETEATEKRLHRQSNSIQRKSTIPASLDLRMFKATCAFFTEYSNVAPGMGKTEFDCIMRLHSAVHPDSILLDMIITVGLTTTAYKHRDMSLQQTADKFYHNVLRRASRVLDDQGNAMSDEMLVTVWLLNLHETLSHGARDAITPPSIHLQGAARLLLLRGQTQFSTFLGLTAFSNLMFRIAMDHLTRQVIVEDGLMELIEISWPFCHREHQLALEIVVAAFRLCNLVNKHDDGDAVVKLDQLQLLDNVLSLWPEAVTHRLEYYLSPAQDGSPFTHHHTFPAHVAAVSWVRYRTVRIMVNQHILQIIGSLSPSFAAGYQYVSSRATATLSTLSADMCSTISYLMDRCGDMTMYEALSAMEPLNLLSGKDWTTAELQPWIDERIGRVATMTTLVRSTTT